MSEPQWKPTAAMMALRERARLLRGIRSYFHQQGVLEVEPPYLSVSTTVDVYIDSFHTDFTPIGSDTRQTCYLNTSPEFPMKRLLAAGSGDIYSLGRVFRNGEAGTRHNPEFTLLEWYRVGMDQQRLMDDVASVLGSVSTFREVRRSSYGELFEQYLAVNPHTASHNALDALVKEKVNDRLTGLDRNDCLDLLFSSCIEPQLGQKPGQKKGNELQGVFVYDYPATLSALARLREDDNGQQVAARFELFVNGVELANGYHELLDGDEQLKRFKEEQKKRKARGLPAYPFDQRLVAALKHGMPDCAGVALGIDRLLMLMLKTATIQDVLAFSFERA